MEDAVLARLASAASRAHARKLPGEDRLACALAALGSVSKTARKALVDAGAALGRRRAFSRPLFLAAASHLAERGDPRAAPLVCDALLTQEAELTVLSAASLLSDSTLTAPLLHLAASRHPDIAFVAELARVVRGESTGEALVALAPRLKEASRTTLCADILKASLARSPLPLAVTPALAVLRDAERHVGRWLVLGELSVRAGDLSPLREAEAKARSGPEATRQVWILAAWALGGASPPATLRLTFDLLSRLSERPTASRDVSFLFRLADTHLSVAKPLLVALVARGSPLSALSARAAFYLARDGDEAAAGALHEGARAHHAPGVAAALLCDLGKEDAALDAARGALSARSHSSVGWGALVHAAAAGTAARPLVTEASFRRLSLGWLS